MGIFLAFCVCVVISFWWFFLRAPRLRNDFAMWRSFGDEGEHGRKSQQLKPDATVYALEPCPGKKHVRRCPPAELLEEDELLTSITENICPNCSQNVLFVMQEHNGQCQNVRCPENISCPDCHQKYKWCPGFFAERIKE